MSGIIKKNKQRPIIFRLKIQSKLTPTLYIQGTFLHTWATEYQFIEALDILLDKAQGKKEYKDKVSFKNIKVLDEESSYNTEPKIICYSAQGISDLDDFSFDDMCDFEDTINDFKDLMNFVTTQLGDVKVTKNIKLSYDVSKTNYYFDHQKELSETSFMPCEGIKMEIK